MNETILQFGAGRFLRAFVDRFVHQANEQGQQVGKIVVVQSTPGSRANLLQEHPEGYPVLVRGYEDGELVERVENVASISRALTADDDWQQVLEVARSPHLRWIVSNATESGYVLEEQDTPQPAGKTPRSLAAKLAQLLWARFQAGQNPVVLLPCELIERNAVKLLELVLEQSRRWSLPADFQEWLRTKCQWLNNLVDCIVTRSPEDHPLAKVNPLMICAEPFALFAIERPAGVDAPLFTHPAIKVVDDVAPYFLRKVRMLNGLHTAMVCKFLNQGHDTVQQLLTDKAAVRWLRGLLFEEIVPVLAYRVDDVALFADQTWDRFRNPFLAHRLSDIALNHEDKIRVRLVPTYEEYKKLFGKAPRRLGEILGKR